MDWLDYRERLNLETNNDFKFNICKTSVLNTFRAISQDSKLGGISFEDYFHFCNMIGEDCRSICLEAGNNHMRFHHCIEIFEDYSSSIIDFLSCYVAFMNSLSLQTTIGFSRDEYKRILANALVTAHLNFEIISVSGDYFVLPKGVKEFDDALVSQPLAWLKDYPKAEKAWLKALREYAEKKADKASDIADLFRKALEAFFQEFFAGGKTLENYKSDYGSYLKAHGVPSSITNNFEVLLQAYTNFMNDCAKHHDATSDKILEYLMYQTGNIMRLLITLRQGEQQDAD